MTEEYQILRYGKRKEGDKKSPIKSYDAVKTTKKCGTSYHILLPKELLGKKVKVVLVE